MGLIVGKSLCKEYIRVMEPDQSSGLQTSSPLLNILHEDGYGTFFQMALSGKSIRIVGYAFVDDTNLIQMAKDHQTFEDVLFKMQKALDLWEGLIKNTGGALAVDKCRWWGIDFTWNDGHWRYK